MCCFKSDKLSITIPIAFRKNNKKLTGGWGIRRHPLIEFRNLQLFLCLCPFLFTTQLNRSAFIFKKVQGLIKNIIHATLIVSERTNNDFSNLSYEIVKVFVSDTRFFIYFLKLILWKAGRDIKTTILMYATQ